MIPNSQAAKGGLKQGDRILAVNIDKYFLSLTVRRKNRTYVLSLRREGRETRRSYDPKKTFISQTSATNFKGSAIRYHSRSETHRANLSNRPSDKNAPAREQESTTYATNPPIASTHEESDSTGITLTHVYRKGTDDSYNPLKAVIQKEHHAPSNSRLARPTQESLPRRAPNLGLVGITPTPAPQSQFNQEAKPSTESAHSRVEFGSDNSLASPAQFPAKALRAYAKQDMYKVTTVSPDILRRRQLIATRASKRGLDVNKALARFDARIKTQGATLEKKLPYVNLPVREYRLDAKKTRILSNYSLELILDRSLSMRRRDCPGAMTRWDWCAYQAREIASALSNYSGQGICVSTFGGEWDVEENCTPDQVAKIMNRHNFTFGTRMFEPLSLRINNHLKNRRPTDKPLLIVVITDGCPYPPPERRLVREEIDRIGRLIRKPHEITVVFMQIGSQDQGGKQYLLKLTNSAKNFGSRNQYVHTRTFDELVKIGLADALVQSIERYTSTADPP